MVFRGCEAQRPIAPLHRDNADVASTAFGTLSRWFSSCSTESGWSRALALRASFIAQRTVLSVVHAGGARCHQTAMPSRIDVLSTCGRSQGVESGTGPAYESQRNTVGVVGLFLQLQIDHIMMVLHSPGDGFAHSVVRFQ